jgi:signal transduction histidine kinase/DNA-binding response OmpR family regulator
VSVPVLSLSIRYEDDVVACRQRARQLARLFGFDARDQTRVATAVSEIARNAFRYAGGGRVEFRLEGRTAPQVFHILVSDPGPGIADLAEIMDGRYRSATGMGLGLIGARRLMDQFHVDSAAGRGTVVSMRKILPRTAAFITPERITAIADALAHEKPRSAIEEVQRQNQELLQALEELRRRQDELRRLNGELEDTNRGVVALYAELDEKADHLRRADELKSRFLSNMSHEFRTPLNSILALSHILLDRTDGELGSEQEKQVLFIRKAAQDLTELVNDLLDLAKVEAGKTVVRPVEFEVANLFGALRGMLRPLLVNESLSLVFEEPAALPPLYTDEGKVSQILRNFISNALKYTERGEVRVSARESADQRRIVFAVADTGIGIAPEDQELIFQEFVQVENPMQRKVKGTGLGLPLARRLAELLGGTVAVTSEPGVGSTFVAEIPVTWTPPAGEARPLPTWEADHLRRPVLVVEDHPETGLIYEKFLSGSPFQVRLARNLRVAREALRTLQPAAIVLDIQLEGEDTWTFLAELKTLAPTREIPVIVVTVVDDQRKAFALGADAYARKPVERAWLLQTLERLTTSPATKRVLVVDDDEVSRYLMRRLLVGVRCEVMEAQNGGEALRLAREARPAAMLLDLVMPELSGGEVIERLQADPETRDIPVIVVTSKVLDATERDWLGARVVAVLPKESASSAAPDTAILEALVRVGLEMAS